MQQRSEQNDRKRTGPARVLDRFMQKWHLVRTERRSQARCRTSGGWLGERALEEWACGERNELTVRSVSE